MTRLPLLATGVSVLLASALFVPSAIAAPQLGPSVAPSADVPTVDSGADLASETEPGYYQVAQPPLAGPGAETLTVYYIPRGTADEAPPEIQRLAAYRDARDSAETTDVTLFGDGAVAMRTAAADDCNANYICLYSLTSYGGGLRQFSANRWQSLADYGFDNTTASVKNRRDGDALLADGYDGGGTRRCVDSHSAVGTLGSFNNQASSVFASELDSRC
ncbi:peptidase inhibitor family I36 protein [Patulibacter defluvii]|uniref:peptidase inhibitor family I36 protein n=1 Tax=Patulibacter defluvii TaxID=3095358 RepID=UPI002A761235|nr:peptidase inhibitor family I36 protein [Patulibacter sp. DM4]